MLVKKEILPPGVHWYVDQKTGQPRTLNATPEVIKHFHDTGKAMLAAELSIPVPLEHQPHAVPLTQAERAAKQLRDNSGWVHDYLIEDGKLFGVLDIQDTSLIPKLPKTIRWCSPHISSFTDGAGRKWDGVISHVALTTRPRIAKQQPFPDMGAAMSFAMTLPDTPLTPALVATTGGDGLDLSRAGLLVAGTAGKLWPAYPVAFSLYSGGISLAADDLKKKFEGDDEEDEVSAPPPFEGETPAEPVAEGTPPLADPNPLPLLQAEEQLVDADGDISVYDVLVDLLESVGIIMPPGTTKDNFAHNLYQAAMEQVKGKISDAASKTQEQQGASNMNGQQTGAAGGAGNNVIQEQPPMYMSLEQAQKIPDPTLRNIALSLVQQQQRTSALVRNAMEHAKRLRTARIDRLLRNLPQAARDQLLAQSAGMQFAMGNDGAVQDQMAPMLDILEAGIRDLPALLTSQQASFSEVAHPREYDGVMSEDRRKAVVEEQCRNTGLAEKKAG